MHNQTLTALAEPASSPRKPNLWAKFCYSLTLRPNGSDLLTRSGLAYLVAMSIIMFFVALAEGTAWGYLGSTFTTHYPIVGWLGMGIFVFGVMWFFDRSLVTADLIEREHRCTLEGTPLPPKPQTFGQHLSNLLIQTWHLKGFLLRIGVAALSLYVTAPYMTQIVFKADIENGMQASFQQAVMSYKNTIVKQFNEKIIATEQKIDINNNKLQAEISGGKSSLSGRYGFGASAKAIQTELNDLKNQHVSLVNVRDHKVSAIEQAIQQGNYPALQALGIRIDKDSPVFRNQEVAKLKHNPAFRETELRVWALLIILAIALFSLKLMQPRALKLYYSSRLQEKWSIYSLGHFDDRLPTLDRSTVLLNCQDATPETFEGVMIRDASKQAEHDAREQKEQALRQASADAEALKAQRIHEAEQEHFSRLAIEKSRAEQRSLEHNWHADQINHALNELKQLENDYLARHGNTIKTLHNAQQDSEEKLLKLSLEHKTQKERIDARHQLISGLEQELEHTHALLFRTRQREDRDRLEVLRLLDDVEKAIMRQQERIKNLKKELLEFELQQKCIDEHRQKQLMLNTKSTTDLKQLQAPLDAVNIERLKIETHRMHLAGQQGILNAPYEVPQAEEIPFLVKKLREQMNEVMSA